MAIICEKKKQNSERSAYNKVQKKNSETKKRKRKF